MLVELPDVCEEDDDDEDELKDCSTVGAMTSSKNPPSPQTRSSTFAQPDISKARGTDINHQRIEILLKARKRCNPGHFRCCPQKRPGPLVKADFRSAGKEWEGFHWSAGTPAMHYNSIFQRLFKFIHRYRSANTVKTYLLYPSSSGKIGGIFYRLQRIPH